MAKPVYVLGTGLSHDGSSCLLKDGRIAVAIEKERLTRRKHDGMNDAETIRYCLEAEGISIEDVALVVQNANFSMFERGSRWFHGPRPIPDEVPTVTISHHLAHAYSAVGTCPFDEAAVLVVDGCGNAFDESLDRAGAFVPEAPPPGLSHLYFEKDSFYRFAGGTLQPLYKDYSPFGHGFREYPLRPGTTMHSIGGVYGAASAYALSGMDDPGKLMGLAPYGRAGAHDFEIFELRDGRVFVRYDWMDRFDRPARSYDDLRRDFAHYADLAFWVQKEVERALLYLVAHRLRLTPSKNLVYAGGVALNAVANRRILTESGVENLHVQPAAGDSGLAVGCAYYGWLEVLKKERIRHDGVTCFGKPYPSSAIQEALRRREGELDVSPAPSGDDACVEAAAELLASGKIIGYFQGGSELGPRALGHRSLLADPRRPEVRDVINATIKLREDFRPFAPSVPLEDAPTYFDCAYASPTMTLVAPIRPAFRDAVPSVVHRDGSCRLQTVTASSDPRFHALHKAFARRSGIPILLNTSLNRRGMPIVETPEQALDFFLSSPLDALVIGPFVVRRREAPGAPDAIAGERLPAGALRGHASARGSHASACADIVSPRAADDPWREFVDRAWGQRPAVLRGIPADLLPSEADAFRALLAACDEFRAQSDFPRIRVSVDGGFLLAGMDEQLPRAEDGSFDGYEARLRTWLKGRSFLLTLNDLPAHDAGFFRRARRFLGGFYRHVGLPPGGMLINLWVGMYDRTPVGIHTDHADTFSALLRGSKRMLVWPHEVFRDHRVYRTPGGEHTGITAYEPYLDRAVALETGREGLAYWPASYWHLATSDGGLSVSLNWAYVNRELPRIAPLELVGKELEALAIARLGKASLDVGSFPLSAGDLARSACALPESIARARGAVGALAGDPVLDEAVAVAWLRRLSALGLREAPRPLRGVALAEEDRLAGDPAAPIVWANASGGRLLVAAAGRSFTLPDDPRVLSLLEQLNAGEPRPAGALERPFASGAGGFSVLEARLLLEELVRTHAIERVP
ncbi:carbamoyltransferase C-terminal domain-containing protein [Sorangium sp. So ce1099]|uniref:carbamoyltransferase C-terminal domain-containing protein n=1 Tax=Sorangium sp. So ce1099 TaxID=3133331 RepID=UPI003F61D8DF